MQPIEQYRLLELYWSKHSRERHKRWSREWTAFSATIDLHSQRCLLGYGHKHSLSMQQHKYLDDLLYALHVSASARYRGTSRRPCPSGEPSGSGALMDFQDEPIVEKGSAVHRSRRAAHD